VAKLRATRRPENSANVLLLRTQMGTGHNGPSGRYSELKEETFELAFILTQLGVKE
jgi:oligopeptidase B